MTALTSADIVTRWLNLIGTYANEPLKLADGRFAIVSKYDADGEAVTACMDWAVKLEADSLEGLAALCEADLKATGDWEE